MPRIRKRESEDVGRSADKQESERHERLVIPRISEIDIVHDSEIRKKQEQVQ